MGLSFHAGPKDWDARDLLAPQGEGSTLTDLLLLTELSQGCRSQPNAFFFVLPDYTEISLAALVV